MAPPRCRAASTLRLACDTSAPQRSAERSAPDDCSTSGRDCDGASETWTHTGRRAFSRRPHFPPKTQQLARRQLLLATASASAASVAAAAAQLLSPAAALAIPDAFAPIPSSPPAPAPLPSASTFLQPLLPAPAADLLAQLEGRAAIYQPGVAWALRNEDRQLYYPAWLEGEWEVTARFAAASFPQGRQLLGRTVPGVLKVRRRHCQGYAGLGGTGQASRPNLCLCVMEKLNAFGAVAYKASGLGAGAAAGVRRRWAGRGEAGRGFRHYYE